MVIQKSDGVKAGGDPHQEMDLAYADRDRVGGMEQQE